MIKHFKFSKLIEYSLEIIYPKVMKRLSDILSIYINFLFG